MDGHWGSEDPHKAIKRFETNNFHLIAIKQFSSTALYPLSPYIRVF